MNMRGIKEQSQQYTIVVLGEARAGKTTFVNQCVFSKVKQAYKPTIEDCYTVLARLPDGKYKTVNVVDTSGSNEFPAMRELRIRSATMVVLIYDVDREDSVESVATLKKQVQQTREYDGVPITVIGNKRGETNNTLNLQIPRGIMDDDSCEHFYIDLGNYEQCMKMYNAMITRCYETCTWKVEVWAMSAKGQESQLPKKRGVFSYLSFRMSKRKRAPVKHTRASKSLS